jgi:hypothetical protein
LLSSPATRPPRWRCVGFSGSACPCGARGWDRAKRDRHRRTDNPVPSLLAQLSADCRATIYTHTSTDTSANSARTFRGEVRIGAADGVVAACDCRRRHRVGEKRRQPVACEANPRGGRRIRSTRAAREEDKRLERHRTVSGVRTRPDRRELRRKRSLRPNPTFSVRWHAPGSIGGSPPRGMGAGGFA